MIVPLHAFRLISFAVAGTDTALIPINRSRPPKTSGGGHHLLVTSSFTKGPLQARNRLRLMWFSCHLLLGPLTCAVPHCGSPSSPCFGAEAVWVFLLTLLFSLLGSPPCKLQLGPYSRSVVTGGLYPNLPHHPTVDFSKSSTSLQYFCFAPKR